MEHEFKIQDVHDQPAHHLTAGFHLHSQTPSAQTRAARSLVPASQDGSVIHSLDDEECCRTVLLLCRGKQAPYWPVYRPDLEADVSQQSCSTDGTERAHICPD